MNFKEIVLALMISESIPTIALGSSTKGEGAVENPQKKKKVRFDDVITSKKSFRLEPDINRDEKIKKIFCEYTSEFAARDSGRRMFLTLLEAECEKDEDLMLGFIKYTLSNIKSFESYTDDSSVVISCINLLSFEDVKNLIEHLASINELDDLTPKWRNTALFCRALMKMKDDASPEGGYVMPPGTLADVPNAFLSAYRNLFQPCNDLEEFEKNQDYDVEERSTGLTPALLWDVAGIAGLVAVIFGAESFFLSFDNLYVNPICWILPGALSIASAATALGKMLYRKFK